MEYTGRKNLEDEDQVALVEEAINQELKRQFENLVKKVQKQQVDPLYLGEYVRQYILKDRWKKEVWLKSLNKAKVTVHVHTLIVSSGTLK